MRNKILGYSLQLALNSIFGYVFMKLLAYLWGTSEEASLFDLAWSIPFLLVAASGLTAIQAVFSSYYSKNALNESQFSETLSSSLNVFFILSLIVFASIYVFKLDLAILLAPDVGPQAHEKLSNLILYLMPLVLFYGTSIILGGVYAGLGVPITAEFVLLGSRILTTGFVIGSLVLYDSHFSAETVSIILFYSAAICSLINLIIARRTLNFKYCFSLSGFLPLTKEVGPQIIMYLVATFLGTLTILYLKRELGIHSTQYIVGFSYSFMLATTAATLSGKTLYFVVTKTYSNLFHAKEYDKAHTFIAKMTFFTLALTITIAVFADYFSYGIINLLLGGGGMKAGAVLMIEKMFSILVYSIPANTFLYMLRVPSITGPNKLHSPIMEIIIWGCSLVTIALFSYKLNIEGYLYIIVFSFWLRCIMMYILIKIQLKSSNNTIAQHQGQ